MEEILASIRKIIAEDPPGSRVAPAPARENAHQNALRSPSQPSANDPFSSIPTRSTSLPSEPAAGGMGSALMKDTAPAPAARDGDPFAQSPASFSLAPRPSRTDDIEAQMADILGAVGQRSMEPNKTPVPANSGVAQPATVIPNSFAPHPATDIPGATPGNAITPDAGSGRDALPANAADPFEFALGPSPFARTAAASADAGAGKAASPAHQPAPQQNPHQAVQQAPANRGSDNFGAFVPGHGGAEKSAAVTNKAPAEPAKSPAPAATFSAPTASTAPSPEARPAANSGSDEVMNETATFNSAASTAARPSPQSSALPATATVAATGNSGTMSKATPSSSITEATVFGGIDAAKGVTSDLDALVPPTAEEIATMAAVAKSAAAKSAAAKFDTAKSVAGDASASVFAPATATPDNSQSTKSGAEKPGQNDRDAVDPIAAFHAQFGAPAASPPKPAPPATNARRVDRVAGGMASAASGSSSVESRALTTTRYAPHSEASDANAIMAAHAMEDTVAELLRPMLRTWLAENMPKIIERALRKELEGSAASDHKTAAE